MQTFLPYPEFIKSAQCLDNKRLGKQRVEAKQILEINLFRTCEEFDWCFCRDCRRIFYLPGNKNLHCVYCNGDDVTGRGKTNKTVKIPWENHPAVLMWRGYEESLAEYGINVCSEWHDRGFEDNLMVFFMKHANQYGSGELPKWSGNKEFHLSHQSNLVRKFPEHYRKFFPDVPNDIPYYWPVKKETNEI